MKVICVDDEKILVNEIIRVCGELSQIKEIKGFTRPKAALEHIKENKTDLALLDIDMPGMNGLELAAKIKEISPDTAIIFMTGYSQYAVDAFKVRASGYLLKPVKKEDFINEIDYVFSQKDKKENAHILVRTFGGFDIFVDGEMVTFKQDKSKELLAYLIDRKGNSVRRPEAFALIFEDKQYDRPMQKQFDVIIRRLRETLREYGIEEIVELKSGSMRVCPEFLECDAYRFFEGDVDAINEFRGEYMNPYSWANITESYMSQKVGGGGDKSEWHRI